ncbi:MAG: flagellar basal body-associated FliL family protein [Verrucomicrobia bacterium]|nr:flagellar basal body-associated FliL family protein [Verrucomicrobiota bacterium]
MSVADVGQSFDAAFRWAWTTSLQASALIGLVWMVQRLFRRSLGSRWQYVLSLLVLIRLLLPDVPASHFSIFNLRDPLVAHSTAPVQSQPSELSTAPASILNWWRTLERRALAVLSLVVTSRRDVPARAAAGGTVSRETALLKLPVAPLDAARTARRPVPTTLDTSRSLLDLTAPTEMKPDQGLDASSPRQSLPTGGSIVSAVPPLAEGVGFQLAAAPKWIWACGAGLLLFGMLERHRRFAKWVTTMEPIRDSRITRLLEDSKKTMRVTRRVQVRSADWLKTPALFGFLTPRLLVPAEISQRLEDRELRLVFLHELAHLRRRDILLNWVIILVQALHWFNPLVWLAMRRLRADRELVCDEMVMTHLDPDGRRLYGNTLIKLAHNFSMAGLSPSLAPVVHRKSEIQRRITMIAQFKPANRLALALGVGLVAVVCCLTFTRAAEKSSTEDQSIVPLSSRSFTFTRPSERNASVASAAAESAASVERLEQESPRGARTPTTIGWLEQELMRQESKLQESQARVDQLRKDLQVSDSNDRAPSSQSVESETVRMIDRDRVMAQSLYTQYNTLFEKLKDMPKEAQRHVIPTASPDTGLTEFLSKLAMTENEFAAYVKDLGENNPKIVQLSSLMASLNAQIDARVDGILKGLQTQAAVQAARIAALDEAEKKAREKEAAQMEKLRPYFQAKRNLETQQRIYETIKLRLLQERIDGALAEGPEGAKPGQPATAASPRGQTEEGKARSRALFAKRNTKIPVPLTRRTIAYHLKGSGRDEDYDRIVVLDWKGEARDEAAADKIVLNLARAGAARFAAARLSLVGEHPELIERMNENHDRLLDAASALIANKTLDDIEQPGFRNLLRAELMARFNDIMGPGTVQEVFITEFVVQ